MASVRMADVARQAGVSLKTVSNVINEWPHVTPATRAKVLRAVEELGYRPHPSARALARGRTGVIALAVPRIGMPYFSELVEHVVVAAQLRRWTVLVEQTEGRRQHEEKVARGHLDQQVDGVIVVPTHPADGLTGPGGPPLVLLGEYGDTAPWPNISIDNVAAARAVTAHLAALGRTRVAAIGDRVSRPPGMGASGQRREGFRQALADAGLEYRPEWVREVADFTGEEGEAAMYRLLDAAGPDGRPDAVFCFTDLMALGALRALRRRGLRVPEDVALAGFDDIPYGRVSAPSLTTITPDRARIAEHAVDLLDRACRTGDSPTSADGLLVPFALTVRESAPPAP
ncbi:LacI family DNA-binding transcriptional regulator [Streptomyces sp. B6B3]|uniref:LacI family DNA-binding transcriptional regulator n=1 Tax=Streptomyces sp. B6B3 TaxID=3153570 RepID=UPI00325EF3B8